LRRVASLRDVHDSLQSASMASVTTFAVRVTGLLTAVAGAAALLAVAPKPASSTGQECGRVEYLSQLEVVFGRAKTLAAVTKIQADVAGAGFANANILPECGGYKVSV